jgi:glycosyltransferase involved in cell wall biosynthesis
MNPNLTIGLLLSEKDFYLFPSWLANHDAIASEIIIGIDASVEKSAQFYLDYNLTNMKSYVWSFSCYLNNNFAAARNSILHYCKTPLMLFLDADELLVPSTKERLLPHLVQLECSNEVNVYSFERLNVFNRTFQDYPNYHACLMKKEVRYVNTSPYMNASPGCHEIPAGMVEKKDLQILHLKENWTGNFRHKGYTDSRNAEAMADVEAKAKKTQIGYSHE